MPQHRGALRDTGQPGAPGCYTAEVRAGHLREGWNEVESRDGDRCAGPQIGSTKSWNSVAKRLAENQQSRNQHQAESDAVWEKRERNMRQASKAAALISHHNWKQTWGMDVNK